MIDCFALVGQLAQKQANIPVGLVGAECRDTGVSSVQKESYKKIICSHARGLPSISRSTRIVSGECPHTHTKEMAKFVKCGAPLA